MMMPWGSAFAINNLGITQDQLVQLFMFAGISTLFIMPFMGKLSDKVNKFKLFTAACIWMCVVVVIYTNLSAIPLWVAIVTNVVMMIGIMGRMVPSMALTSALPSMQDRGAFMSINSSLQQIAGGIAAAVGGMIVVQKDKNSPLEHYDTLGYVIVGITIVSIFLVYRVYKLIENKKAEQGNVVIPQQH